MEEEGGSAGSGVDVTVEREPSAESERAVKQPDEEVDIGETEESDSDAEPAAEPDAASGTADDERDEDEAAAAGTDAAASTESLVDDEHVDDSTRAAEPGEAVGPDDDGGPDAAEGEPTTVLKGIGPAYADRLSEAGIDTVAELAAADADDLAERVDLSPKRVGRWVETAQDHD